jgi:hypothetical protein
MMMDQQASSSSLSWDLAILVSSFPFVHTVPTSKVSVWNQYHYAGVNAIHRYYPPTPLHDMTVIKNVLACLLALVEAEAREKQRNNE